MKILKHLIAFAFILGMSSMASAAIPPPPVNQNLGIPDTAFSNFSQELCQACHWASYRDDEPLSGAPVKPGYNPDRHHLAVGTEIDGKPEYPPERDANGDGVTDTHFSCLNCHKILWEGTDVVYGTLMDIIVPNYRNCLNCHKRDVPVDAPGPLTVHHATDLAQTGFCFRCHGGLVRGIDVDTNLGKKPDPSNPGDLTATVPVEIPTYAHSIITPWRSGKPNGDDNPDNLSSAGTEPGNCNYCHNTESGFDSPGVNGDQGGTPQVVNLPNGDTFIAPVLTNAKNHHNTGFFDDNRCVWCHEIDGEFQNGGQAIRVCQRCHDRTTLHNIEFDAIGDGVTPGGEEAYFGHIGNQKNCWGCHGNNKKVLNDQGIWVSPRDYLGVENQGVVIGDEENARLDVVTALVPTIDTLSVQSVSTGEEVKITLTGTNIVNSSKANVVVTNDDGTPKIGDDGKGIIETALRTWSSEVVITDKDNNFTVITPEYQDTNKLEFTLPGTLAKGFYQVTLKKDFIASQKPVINEDGALVMVDKKDTHTSNPLGLTVTPSINVRQGFVYTPYGGLVVLSGKNFMETVSGFTYKIVDQNGQPPIAVYLWRDDLIIAKFQDIPENVTIEHLFDEKTIPLDQY